MDTRSFISVLLVLALISAPARAAVSDEVPARKPLTYRDSGLYGWWLPYFWEGPFDFVIVQAWVPPTLGEQKIRKPQNASGVENAKHWNEYLRKARAAGKRVIVMTTPGQGHVFTEDYFKGLVSFLETVDRDQIYAITLAEENVFWKGQSDKMADFYHRLKEKFPNLPVWQFYSNTSRADGIPGFKWPWVPADGWMLDEYVATPDDFEQAIRRFRMLGKPIVNIVWAAPYMSSSRQTGVPFHRNVFHSKLRVAERHNIPTAYFAWDGPADDTWAWEEGANQENKTFFEKHVLKAMEEFRRSPEPGPVTAEANLDLVDTVLEPGDDGSLAYRESFDLRMKEADPNYRVKHDFMARTHTNGLRFMRWEPSPSRIIIQADTEGFADAALISRWRTPENKPTHFEASVKFASAPAQAAKIIFEFSSNGYDWETQTTDVSPATNIMRLAGAPSGEQVTTRLRVASDSAPADAVLAEIDWIEVRAVPADGDP